MCNLFCVFFKVRFWFSLLTVPIPACVRPTTYAIGLGKKNMKLLYCRYTTGITVNRVSRNGYKFIIIFT